MKRADVQALIREINPRSILAIDPDAHTPGAAWCPDVREDAPCWVWGGNKGGAPLGTWSGCAAILARLSPDLVLIEAALSSGGAFAASMHDQNIVRGGWVWMARAAGCRPVLVPPRAWQDWLVKASAVARVVYRERKGQDERTKHAYKAHAAARVNDGKKANEDAAAALGMLDFALSALGRGVGKVTRGLP